jgi:limonene 1,2-monooxygenase
MFGVGVGGGLPSDLRVVGLTPVQAGARMEESLEVMMRLLTDETPVSARTDWFEIHEAVLQLAPYSRPHMQLAMASTNPRNAATMGRYGGLILAGAVPERVPELVDAMRRGGAKSGRPASAAQIRLSYAMHLADSREQAIEEFREGAIMEHYDFNVAVNGVQKPHESPNEWYQTYLGRHFIGDPDDAIARIEEIEAKSGGVGGLLFTSRDWAGPEAATRSWELFASHVAPRFGGERG